MGSAEKIEASIPVEVSDPASEDAAAAKKREENRKKRERQKKKKAEEKEATTGAARLGRWQTGKLPGGLAERRDAGGARGLGVFGLDDFQAGATVATAPPALSCIFDGSADKVCAFCFDCPKPDATTEHSVTLGTAPDESGNKTFGIKLDDFAAPDGNEPIITMVTKMSANREHVRIGDRVVSIDGEPVSGGHKAAVSMLLAAAQKHGGSVPAVLRRPAMFTCQGCKKLSCCSKCIGEGRLNWHGAECALYRALPESAKKGETATLRMLLRYKIATEPSFGDWPSDSKEPVGLITSLQANAVDVPPDQLNQLSSLTHVSAKNVASLIYQVRTNACEISRGGQKVGCALSVLMGWHNHDCTPNAASVIGEDGAVTITTLRETKKDEEVTISYVDPKLPFDERRKTLQSHYGFDCRCERCVTEQRKELKTKMAQRDAYMQAQRR